MTDHNPSGIPDTGLPPGTPINVQMAHLLEKIARLQEQVRELKKPTPEQTAEEKREALEDDRRERKRRAEEARAEAAAAELAIARAEAIRAVARLLPEAVKQAKAKPPRPALLRLILRATR